MVDGFNGIVAEKCAAENADDITIVVAVKGKHCGWTKPDDAGKSVKTLLSCCESSRPRSDKC